MCVYLQDHRRRGVLLLEELQEGHAEHDMADIIHGGLLMKGGPVNCGGLGQVHQALKARVDNDAIDVRVLCSDSGPLSSALYVYE